MSVPLRAFIPVAADACRAIAWRKGELRRGTKLEAQKGFRRVQGPEGSADQSGAAVVFHPFRVLLFLRYSSVPSVSSVSFRVFPCLPVSSASFRAFRVLPCPSALPEAESLPGKALHSLSPRSSLSSLMSRTSFPRSRFWKRLGTISFEVHSSTATRFWRSISCG